MKLSIKYKLLLPILFLTLIGMGIIGAVSYFSSKDIVQQAITSQLIQVANNIVISIDTWMDARKLDLKNWGDQDIYQKAVLDDIVGKSARKAANARLEKLKSDYDFLQSIHLADINGTILSSANADQDGQNNSLNLSQNPAFQAAIKGQLTVSEVMKSPINGSPVYLVIAPVQKSGAVQGALVAMIDLETFSKTFVYPISIGKQGHAYLYSQSGGLIAHRESVKLFNENIQSLNYSDLMRKSNAGIISYIHAGQQKIAAFNRDEVTGWTVVVEADENEIFYAANQAKYINILVSFVIAILLGIIVLMLVRKITNSLNRTVAVAYSISQGRLDNDVQIDSSDEIGRLLHTLREMQTVIRGVVSQVQDSSATVNEAAAEIAQGSADLSQRTEEQASALEETAASMEQLTATVKQSADNAGHANQLASAARQQAELGGQVVERAINAMTAINQSSRKIADIIGVIDEIAFQTNLLALNAAVEAARAGEQGRGFAVVAGEVRKLAQRSANAAKEIKSLISDSVNKAGDGSALVDQTGHTLKEIMTAVKKVSDIVAEMAAAAREQADGIDQVNQAVLQMDRATQQNAALVEQTAAASQSMISQAQRLQRLMDFFKLGAVSAAPAVQPVALSPAVIQLPPQPAADRRSRNRPWETSTKPTRVSARKFVALLPVPSSQKTAASDGNGGWNEVQHTPQAALRGGPADGWEEF